MRQVGTTAFGHQLGAIDSRRWRLDGEDLKPIGAAHTQRAGLRFIGDDGRWGIIQDVRGEFAAVDLRTGEDWPIPSDEAAIQGFGRALNVSSDGQWLLYKPTPMAFPHEDPGRLEEWMRYDHTASRLWDTVSGECHRLDGTPTLHLETFAVCRRTNRLVGLFGGDLRTWDLVTGRFEAREHREGFAGASAVLSGDAQWLLTWWPGGESAILRTADGQCRRLCDEAAARHWALSDDGRYAANWEDDLTVWDLRAASACARFVGESRITACCFVRGGHAVLVGEAVGHLHLLKVA